MSSQLKPTNGDRNSRHISPLLKIALLLGVLLHLSGFFIFRVIFNPLPSSEEGAAFIALVPTDVEDDEDELIEQASLFDSAPLFIPGEWSSASNVFSSRVLQDWQVLPDFEPSIELKEEVQPDRLSLPVIAAVEEPSDLLDFRFWDLFSAFGQGEIQMEAPGAWNSLAVATVISGNGEYSPGSSIHLEADLASGEFAMRPLVYFLNMSAPGLPLGDPLLRQSSGSASLDAEVAEWLTRPDTLAKLPAGFLELRVFP